MRRIVFYLIYFLCGCAAGFLFNDLITVKKVKVVVDQGKIAEYIQRSQDSIRRVYDAKFDSIQKIVPIKETEIKIIYKNLDREKNTISLTRNVDSLRRSAIEYVKSAK